MFGFCRCQYWCQCVTKVECPNTPVETGHRSLEDIREVLNHERSSDNVQTDVLMLSRPHQKHFIQILILDKPLYCTQANCALKCTYLDWTRTYSSFRQSESTVALKIKWSVSMLSGVSDILQWSSIHLSFFVSFCFFCQFLRLSVVKVTCIDAA